MSQRGQIFAPAGLRQSVHRRLVQTITQTPADERLAVFDFDNTCILGDIGELFSHFLIDEMRYRYDLDAFWNLIDVQDGRDEIRGLVENIVSIPLAQRTRSPLYHEYLAEMGAVYDRKLVRDGKAACYAWAVRLHVGLNEDEMQAWSRQAISRELEHDVREEERLTTRGENVLIRRGIRPFVEIRRIMRALRDHGWDVWIVSATNWWTVKEAACLFEVPPERVLGNRVHLESDTLTDQLEPPALFRRGKVDIIAREIGRQPALVFGDSDTDFEMLCEASRLAVVIDHGNALLREEASRRRWAVQPQSELTPGDVTSHER